MIMDGEKKDLEEKVLELEIQKFAVNKQAEELRTWAKELEAQNKSLETQLKTTTERQPDIIPFCDQACSIWRNIHQVQLKRIEEIYKVQKEETRLNKIEYISIIT